MKVFSRRYSSRDFIRLRRFYGNIGPLNRSAPVYRRSFLDQKLRVRLSELIRYLVSTGEYIEPFLLSKYNDEGSFFLNSTALQRLSFQELGYDLTEYYSTEDMVPRRVETEEDKVYYDNYLIDLVEILIIFSLEDKRDEVISRFKNIFEEESSDLLIYGHMVIIQDLGGLQSVMSLLTDTTLKNKPEDILIKQIQTSVAAREAADVTQRVFSGQSQGQTKAASSQIIERISRRWIEQDDQESFKKLMNDLVKNIKGINNQINNIRHTDRSTIEFGSSDIFKMIKDLNLAVSEMAILSTQDDFIEKESVEDLKNGYLNNFAISNEVHVINRPLGEQPVNLADIPF